MLILDSGGLLAALDADQHDHGAFATTLATFVEQLVISPFVVAELDYMILREFGREVQLSFLREIERGAYRLVQFDASDFSRALELVAHYHYLTSFGIADASCVVLAERFRTTDILTTDQRDFRHVTLSGGQFFRILPYDLAE